MEVGLLGALEVRGVDGAINVSGSRQRTLLAVLALRPGAVMPADRLIDDVWAGAPPQQPSNTLQVVVFKLRKALGAEQVLTQPPGYALLIADDDVDALRFERLVGDGRSALNDGSIEAAVDSFDRALALWRDAALLEFADAPSAVAAAARWEELRATVREDRFEALLAVGRDGELVPELNAAIEAAPFRERLRRQLMLALYRSGRQADALRAFAETRRVLAEELGLEPGLELRRLETAILDQDASLEVATRTRSALATGARPIDGAVTTAQPVAVDVRSGAPRLVGRAPELRALRADLAALDAGRGGVTLIGGEPGIGKTRLAEELTREAAVQGAAVVWGRCFAGRGAPTFWPWIQAINGVLAQIDDQQLRQALKFGAPELGQLVPEIKELFGDLPAPAATDPETARFRLLEAISMFLRRLADSTRLVIAIDDLQWADAASLELLGRVAGQVSDVPLLLVATYRTVQPAVDGDLAAALVEVGRHCDVRHLHVEGLEPPAIAELLVERGATASSDGVASMHRRTRGNPFFVTEIARLIAASGNSIEDDALSDAIPASVRGVLRSRLGQLPERTIKTLGAAAVVGGDVDPQLLAAMIDTDVADVLDDLQPAVDAGLLAGVTSAMGRYRFSHGLVVETIYAGLGAGTKGRLHLEAAKALHAHHGAGTGAHLIPIADHWFRAVPIASIDDAIDAAVRASQWAVTNVAHQQADEQLRAALELVAVLPEGEHRANRELAVLNELTTLMILGGGYCADGLEQACARMRELSLRVDDRGLQLGSLWRLSVYYCTLPQLDMAIELGEQMVRLGELDGDESMILAGHMALGPPHLMCGHLVESARHLDIALQACRQGRAAALAAVVLETPEVWSPSFSSIVAVLRGDAARAEQLAQQAITAGVEVGPKSYPASVAVGLAGWTSVIARDAVQAMPRCDESIASAIEGGFEVRMFIEAIRGWVTAAAGDVDRGASEIELASQMLRGAGAHLFRPFHLALLADAMMMDQRALAALDYANEGLDAVRRTGEAWCQAELYRLRGVAQQRLGDSAQAAADLALAIEVADDQSSTLFMHRAQADLARLTSANATAG